MFLGVGLGGPGWAWPTQMKNDRKNELGISEMRVVLMYQRSKHT